MSTAVAEPESAESNQYVALYRKYRPRRFSELVGQDAVATGFKAAVRDHRVPHAHLLVGSRGTGKTTTARILAAALLCPNVEDGDPCGECAVCEGIHEGNLSGIVDEVNATNQRGIDAMKNLVNTMTLASTMAYRIYIIDEVHQLSQDAASLLLKYLEEPPADNIVFILATTDPHKVLDTIRSRSVVTNFSLIDKANLEILVRRIAKAESLELSDDDVRKIVAAGHGSARDTITTLERYLIGGIGEADGLMVSVAEALVHRNLAPAFLAIARADQEGSLDARRLAEDVVAFYRDALIYQQQPELVDPAPDLEGLVSAASKFSTSKLIWAIETMSSVLATMRTAGSNRIALEGGLSRLMVPTTRQAELITINEKLDGLIALLSNVGSIPENVVVEKQTETKLEAVSQDDFAEKPRSRGRRSKKRSEPEVETETEIEAEISEPEPEQVIEVPEVDDDGEHLTIQQLMDSLLERGTVGSRSMTLLSNSKFWFDDQSLSYVLYSPREVTPRTRREIESLVEDKVRFQVA